MRRTYNLLLWALPPLLTLAGCGSDLLLGPDAAQGIEGIALKGPMCPVVSQDDPCPDQPYPATIVVQDADGRTVTTLHLGNDGRFRVGLEPGRYTLQPRSGDPLPHAGALDVDVPAGVWVDVTVVYDTGIR